LFPFLKAGSRISAFRPSVLSEVEALDDAISFNFAVSE